MSPVKICVAPSSDSPTLAVVNRLLVMVCCEQSAVVNGVWACDRQSQGWKGRQGGEETRRRRLVRNLATPLILSFNVVFLRAHHSEYTTYWPQESICYRYSHRLEGIFTGKLKIKRRWNKSPCVISARVAWNIKWRREYVSSCCFVIWHPIELVGNCQSTREWIGVELVEKERQGILKKWINMNWNV